MLGAETALAQNPAGAAKLQEFHRQLFLTASDDFRREIARITGREVREAAAEIESQTGTVLHAFTTGTIVQIFLLSPKKIMNLSNLDEPELNSQSNVLDI